MSKYWAAVLFLVAADAAVAGHFAERVPEGERWLTLFPGAVSWILALAVLAALARFIARPAIVLLAAGAIGNLLTYLRFGRVVDYIPTPVSFLNMADILIVGGIILASGSLFIKIFNNRRP